MANAAIYNAFMPEDYSVRQARRSQLQDAEQNRQFNALRLQTAQAEMADKERARQEAEAVRNALQGASTDDDRINRLMGLGTATGFTQADALRKSGMESKKTAAEIDYKQAQADKERLATTKDRLGMVLNVVSAAKDPVSYEQGLRFLQSNGIDLAGVPQQFDPRYVAAAGQQAMTAMQRLDQEWKAKGYDLDVQRQQETVRHNKSQEGLTARGQNMVDARARESMAQERENAKATQVKPVVASEDERKAAGWLAQADNAWKNMQSVGLSGGKPTSAAKPGLIESQMLIPEALKNMSRSDKRQQFVQAASSLSEALLRAATGAGVNESEAKQKISELTPQFGDSQAVIEQKFGAIPMYIESLKTRAGRAAPGAAPSGVVDFGSLK